MFKRMAIMIIVLVLVFGGIFGWKAVQGYFIGQYFAHFTPPPETVSTQHARAETWQPVLNTVGTISAVNGVEVSPEVAGMVREILFQSGQEVQQGQLLVQLDDSGDRADLAGLKAQQRLARLNYDRQQSLIKKNLTSDSDLDAARTLLDQANANVISKETLIAKKAIRAPFAGRVGIRQINVGQYLAPGSPIVTLQSIAPVYADFTVPEQRLRDTRAGQDVDVQVDAYPKQKFRGKISAVDAKVNEQTRNVMLQATLDNADHRLQPGMFANVEVLLPPQGDVVTVPRTAITYSLYGDSVYIVEHGKPDKDGKPTLIARQQFVKTGAERNDRVVIRSGVKAGDEVVTAGQIKLHDGAGIRIDNSVALQ